MITRSAFLVSAGMLVASPAIAKAPSTALLLSSSAPDLDDQYLDFVSGALRGRGVNIYDPSSADATYHERASIVAEAIGPVLTAAISRVAWVETHYHTRRAMFVHLDIHSSSLPYGGFIVHVARATGSFRCFDTGTHAIIAAGTARGEGRGEDLDLASQQAGNRCLLSLAEMAAPRLH